MTTEELVARVQPLMDRPYSTINEGSHADLRWWRDAAAKLVEENDELRKELEVTQAELELAQKSLDDNWVTHQRVIKAEAERDALIGLDGIGVDRLLERFDQTEPAIQRGIVAKVFVQCEEMRRQFVSLAGMSNPEAHWGDIIVVLSANAIAGSIERHWREAQK